ncbi:MAG TPA: alkaline phosphatase family protein [Candidatus Polarisedimenticolia bacterium]|nr:alkaline phosphatase family protein [Candidatus Polarisedimenticolia bacterium]
MLRRPSAAARRAPLALALLLGCVPGGSVPGFTAAAQAAETTRVPRPAVPSTAAPGPGAGTGAPASARSAAPGGTRLVVLLVVDQLRADYLDRLEPRFGPDGFRRLIRQGARFTECAYPYALTETGPGHATLATGTTPDRHGIVSNDWLDPATKRIVAAVDDADFPLVGAAGTGVSPRRLMVDTIGDSLRLATRGAAKVWSVAGKDRSAVFAAGRGASGAIWYDINSGLFVSSRWYMTSLPAWAERLNAERPSDRLLKETGSKDFDFLRGTPQFHDLMFEAARRMVESEGLGDDSIPDLLVVGLSGVDILGHQFGPYDEKVERLVVRLDAQIGAFLTWLDGRIGAGRIVVALSADHGCGPTEEQARAAGLRPERIDRRRLAEAMRQALAVRAGSHPAPRLYDDGPLDLWFDAGELGKAGLTPDEAADAAGQAALEVPGIYGYVTGDGRTSVEPALAETFRLSRFPGRTPDLLLIPGLYAVDPDGSAATHGTPWSYDRRVPLLLAGAPFRAEVDTTPCSPADLAPTIAAALRIPPPAGASGHILASSLARAGMNRR